MPPNPILVIKAPIVHPQGLKCKGLEEPGGAKAIHSDMALMDHIVSSSA